MATPVRPHPDGSLVSVWVVPGAQRDELVGLHGGDVKVRVAAPPEGGRATEAVAQLLQSATGARGVSLVRGATSRRKQYVLHGVAPDHAAAALGLGAAGTSDGR